MVAASRSRGSRTISVRPPLSSVMSRSAPRSTGSLHPWLQVRPCGGGHIGGGGGGNGLPPRPPRGGGRGNGNGPRPWELGGPPGGQKGVLPPPRPAGQKRGLPFAVRAFLLGGA